MTAMDEDLVYWLDPWAWDKELRLVPLRAQRAPVGRWLALLHAQGWRIMLLPYDARIAGGPCAGGHVVAVETGEGRQYAALPPRAIPALRGEIPEADYLALLRATPALATVPPSPDDRRGDP